MILTCYYVCGNVILLEYLLFMNIHCKYVQKLKIFILKPQKQPKQTFSHIPPNQTKPIRHSESLAYQTKPFATSNLTPSQNNLS